MEQNEEKWKALQFTTATLKVRNQDEEDDDEKSVIARESNKERKIVEFFNFNRW